MESVRLSPSSQGKQYRYASYQNHGLGLPHLESSSSLRIPRPGRNNEWNTLQIDSGWTAGVFKAAPYTYHAHSCVSLTLLTTQKYFYLSKLQ